MSPVHNAGEAPLRVGLIAPAGEVEPFRAAIGACDGLRLTAAGGMPQSAAPAETQWFDDTRVLIAQAEINALVLAGAPKAGVELGERAAAAGRHVWRTPPLARTFAEAVDAVQKARGAGVVYRVASWWEHVGDVLRAALRAREGFRPQLSELLVRAEGPPLGSWRSSQVDAGGGVVATDAYPLLEALIAVRGLPDRVTSAVGKVRRVEGLAPRETEDVALAIFQYESGGLAVLRATWDIAPFEWCCWHHSGEASVTFDRQSVAVLGTADAVRHERALPDRLVAAELGRFAEAVRTAQAGDAQAPAIERHLAVTALLETLYLSARTGQPESPRKLYEVQKWPAPR